MNLIKLEMTTKDGCAPQIVIIVIQGRRAMIMEPLLAALRRVRNDLKHICTDFECIEAHLRSSGRVVCPRVSDLDNHVDDLDRHLVEITTQIASLERRPDS